jgi:Na+-transporting NADH:ubiquinone oxidoreductase subunit C
MSNDSRLETLKVAAVLCLVCSVAVSTAAVVLKPLQERNKAQAMRGEILRAAGLFEEGADIDLLFDEWIRTRLVDLDTGEYVDHVDPHTYDQRAAARDPNASVTVSPEQDIAAIKRRAAYAPVYLVGDEDRPELIVLPVHGYGLWSTMYALLALDGRANKIKGISFYEHGETAGLGAEIENPRWQAGWMGKQVFDESGSVRFELAKGGVDPSSSGAKYRVDGLSGATLTADGVTNMMRYWMSDQGFGNYLARFHGNRPDGVIQ